MKTKQIKEEQHTDEETVIEPKTRARKKASDIINDEKNKGGQDEPKTSKDPKKVLPKPRAIVKKRPLGIRTALRSKKGGTVKEKVSKNVIKAKRGRKPAVKVGPESPQDKEPSLIPAAEIKKEPVEDTSPNSRSSSPKTAGRRVRVSSDMAMMKTMLSDSPSTLVLGPRTSPYSMRSERSNSPSLTEAKNLRTGKPRKVKNLLSEVVIKEQKKRRRLLSDSKNPETSEEQDCKKLKRGRSCSRDGSEVSKCSDNTESDISMSETLNDSDSKDTNKKLDKSKTDLDVDIENSIQITTIEKVPSLNTDSKSAETTLDPETSIVCETTKKSSLQRSSSLDSDNNNSNRLKLDALNSSDIEDNLSFKTEDDMLSEARSNILTSMSKTFNSKELCKNIRRARRGRKAAEARRPSRPPARPAPPKAPATSTSTSTITEPLDDKHETIETLSKDIDDLIKNLDQNIDGDHETNAESATALPENVNVPVLEESEADKNCGLAKPLNSVDDNAMAVPDTPVKEKEAVTAVSMENTPSKLDESENIRLHYEEDSIDKADSAITYTKPVASIDKLMDRLKEFEEFDKRRQRLESESKPSDSKPVMVTNDVVLIHKSGAEFKPLDIQSVRSPERTIEKENVLSCFENNSAISIVKRDQVRRSVDIDLPNSVTLIKRNSVSARKESTSSNHSRESDAVTIFEKSLGKDVTLTEIRKSVDKSGTSMDLHQFAALHPGNASPAVSNMMLDHSQISITRSSESKVPSSDFQIPKRKSREDSLSQKTESTDLEELSAILAEVRKISPSASPSHQPPYLVAPVPVAIKSLEAAPVETEALPPPLETIKPDLFIPETPVFSETPVELKQNEPKPEEIAEAIAKASEILPELKSIIPDSEKEDPETMEVEKTPVIEEAVIAKPENIEPVKEDIKPVEVPKSIKKSLRNSIESLPGPSNAFNETPECQKRKENVLRTLGLLTHKAAKEAKMEKAKEKERIFSERMSNKGKASKSSTDYTGTLKTVIKLNRGGEKKKHRTSLKMTFQKSKYRSGKPTPEVGEAAADDSPFYTIERREIAAASSADGGQRKSHYSNRLNHHDSEPTPEPSEPKETLNLVIPEKASSFSIHPGRLCMDQCFYCGGKFGLFDTPCHIAQIKSSERQKKVLDNEEKLTIDSCLCDACYRHVDRRANCPSYRKRPLPKQSDLPKNEPPTPTGEKPSSPPMEEESESDSTGAASGRVATCHTEGCTAAGDYSIRRKWLIKMRSSVNKVLKLKGDYPGLHTLPLCGAHHRVLAPLMACQLCRRRLTKHHNLHFIHHGYLDLNPLLTAAHIPVQFNSRVVLCKGCRYYCSLLQRPGHNDEYANGYRRKLLQVYNIEVPPEPEGSNTLGNLSITLSLDPGKIKKKQRNKSKQRKSTEPDMSSETSSEKTNESTPEKEEKPIEEDIESLISSNKILVPIKAPANDVHPSDGSDENSGELPAIVNKQTELQYLLQKQNNPAQFLAQPNLTQKQRNILKLQTVPAIQKPASQHRITEKNAKKIHKIGQQLLNKEKVVTKKDEMEIFEEKNKDCFPVLQNLNLNDECTIESIPPKRAPDINTLKNKWQMSESFTQVKKNLSELSKKLPVEKEPKKSEQKYTNPVKRLETNPSISVRELFPGEEEMNLQCSVEFNNVKGVTPEGWEKCNTTIQYDNETKRLWTELQRPYGNQSSFLRHLVLLEKYFRSGDLVLSHNASPPAANYSDSVQSRLRAYDNVVNDTPRRAEPAISLIEYRKKPSINGKSLLKSNQMDDKETKKFMPPPSGTPKLKQKDKTRKQLPPELIAINTPNAQGRKAIQNVLHNIQQLVKGVSASDPTEVAAAPLPNLPLPAVMPGLPLSTALPIPIASPKPALPGTPPVAKTDPPAKEKKDKSDTPKKSKHSSKPWRPTLMPITSENLAKITREPTQLAVDGRSLPSLVQVMSSGKRYHITLQDYNKMCIMRREKLQQLQDGEKKRPSLDDSTVVTELQPSTMLGNGGTVTQINSDDKKEEYTSNAATILKNVGLKNITIAPIPAKTSTVTSPAPMVSSPLMITSTPIKFPQLGPAVSITSETVLTPNLPIMTSTMIMPKIPKSLTIVPQTVMASVPQNIVMTSPQVLQSDGPRP